MLYLLPSLLDVDVGVDVDVDVLAGIHNDVFSGKCIYKSLSTDN